ncbi:hypothetical protein D3C86_1592470 [compost metagenome]
MYGSIIAGLTIAPVQPAIEIAFGLQQQVTSGADQCICLQYMYFRCNDPKLNSIGKGAGAIRRYYIIGTCAMDSDCSCSTAIVPGVCIQSRVKSINRNRSTFTDAGVAWQ